MNILILGDYENVYSASEAAERLKNKGWHITSITRPVRSEEVPALAEDAEAIVLVRERTPMNRPVIEQLRKVKLISQTGKGTAHLDTEALEEIGIDLRKTPGGAKASVVELTIGLMIGVSRQFALHQHSFQKGEWIQNPGMELRGKQLGILGFGSIGREVTTVAQALGMRVKVWRPTGGDGLEKDYNVEAAELEEILQTSDVISLHMRFTPEWEGFLTKDKLSLMKKHAVFINTSRGAFVEEDALAELIAKKSIGGAGIDVFGEEPLRDHPFLRNTDNILLTPHIGYVTFDVLQRFAEAALTNVEQYF
ncbi:NAD(P)-dependent oxidoreductase [Salibacterium aidingense]|uniref:NAD(P)-dependent oxidoreductase n=1 Tax=Salibacterium aidingense TaxID=384933 RepID=UPI00041FEFB8|nr:NAD(P)-dependent oxidoreductase [Salibacterium aidingense]